MSKMQNAAVDGSPPGAFVWLPRREWCGPRAAVLAPALAFGLISMAGGANAQSGGQIAPPGGKDRFGGDIHSSANYASNISGGNDTLAAIRRIEPADITYDFGGTLRFQLLSGRKVMFLTAAADAHRHQNNKLLDGEDYSVTGGIGGQVGPCSGLLGGSYVRNQALIEDLALPVATNITETPSGSLSVSCGRGALIGGVQVAVSRIQNPMKKVGFVDSETKAISATIGYHNDTVGDLSVLTQYTKVAYSSPFVSSIPSRASINPDFDSYGIGLQYARKIGMRLSGTMSVSATQLKSGVSKNSGVTANAALNYAATSRIQMQLSYNLGDQASVLANASYIHTDAAVFNVGYRLSERISASAGVSRTHESYRGGVPLPLQLRDSNQITETLGASMRIGRNINLTLSGSHSNRTADVAIYNSTSNNVSLGVATQF